MTYAISDASRMASAAAVILLALLLMLRHMFLPRLDEGQLRRFDAPLVLLFGVFVIYLLGNFLEALG
jgi:hypothetical protein